MHNSASFIFLVILMLPHGCVTRWSGQQPRLKHPAVAQSPQLIALYEAWFGHPKHISIGYSSQDPATINNQIHRAKAMGISAFVVDWYGDREPFIDQSYAVIQASAASNKFQVAMMYDESDEEVGATDQAIADFTMFHDAYLSSKALGHEAYLTYEGRPVIFIFPKGRHTDWIKIRALVNKWNPPALLIYESLPGPDAAAFDGFYAWINPGEKGWAADGSNWGEKYLDEFYQIMRTKYSDRIIVGGAWASFDDSGASWGLNRHISARCGRTFADTSNAWRKYFSADDLLPFVMIETWNDHEEGTAVEDGIPSCGSGMQRNPIASPAGISQPLQEQR